MKHRISNIKHRGVSLLFALIALVALSLASLALVRSIDTGALVLGNIGFKQDATVAGDQATDQAINWLKNNLASLNDDAPASGYYASTKELNADKSNTRVDATGQQYPNDVSRKLIDWENDTKCNYATEKTFASCTLKSMSAGTINGNQARYTIFRLCASAGDPGDEINNSCAAPLRSASGSTSKGGISYGKGPLSGVGSVYYRVVVRVQGARNTTSVIESIVNFQ